MTQTTGHRGVAFLEPENTLLGFKKAIELGMDCVEFDVRRCKSGELVVMHDAAVDRTTNGKGLVAEMTLQQLKKLDAGKGEKIPTLQEVMDLCKGKLKMYIELKEAGLEEDVVAAIVKNEIIGSCTVNSFFHDCVRKIKEINSSIRTGILIVGNPVNIAEVAKAAKADVVSADHEYTDRRMVDELKKAGIGIVAGICNTEKDMVRMAKLGVDGIISDRPDLLAGTVKKWKK